MSHNTNLTNMFTNTQT